MLLTEDEAEITCVLYNNIKSWGTCPLPPPHRPELANPGRVFDTERKLAHGGNRGVVDETYDSSGSARAIGGGGAAMIPDGAMRALERKTRGHAAWALPAEVPHGWHLSGCRFAVPTAPSTGNHGRTTRRQRAPETLHVYPASLVSCGLSATAPRTRPTCYRSSSPPTRYKWHANSNGRKHTGVDFDARHTTSRTARAGDADGAPVDQSDAAAVIALVVRSTQRRSYQPAEEEATGVDAGRGSTRSARSRSALPTARGSSVVSPPVTGPAGVAAPRGSDLLERLEIPPHPAPTAPRQLAYRAKLLRLRLGGERSPTELAFPCAPRLQAPVPTDGRDGGRAQDKEGVTAAVWGHERGNGREGATRRMPSRCG
ncbi:hypothetical protein HU200_009593 [Digitaria exilis]|uniref:Uncharacterized protein n=1 Tax=Digitaria exilis TaxID=1010633 RepID=A0A835FIW5_9POAL|nr:hypothetical protein HU200_009593 [Digitaria exilis]